MLQIILLGTMKFGLARVSTEDQNLDLQVDALKAAGCEKIFTEKISSRSKDRPEVIKLISQLRKGDDVVVWKLDRLGRSLRDLIGYITKFEEMEVGFISLQDNIDTSTTTGRFIFNIFASLAEFEREIIRDRTKAGLASARARGRKGGRPAGLSAENLHKAQTALMLYEKGEKKVEDIAAVLGISRVTCYRYINTARKTPSAPVKARSRGIKALLADNSGVAEEK